MPRRRKLASGKRSRAGALTQVLALAGAMEQPLMRARGMADALAFVGYGLESLEYDGAQPVLALSTSLMDDLESLFKSWNAMYRAAERR
jgi:hypothetical protein